MKNKWKPNSSSSRKNLCTCHSQWHRHHKPEHTCETLVGLSHKDSKLVVEFGRICNRFRIVLGCNAVELVVSRHVRRVYTEVALEWNEQFMWSPHFEISDGWDQAIVRSMIKHVFTHTWDSAVYVHCTHRSCSRMKWRAPHQHLQKCTVWKCLMLHFGPVKFLVNSKSLSTYEFVNDAPEWNEQFTWTWRVSLSIWWVISTIWQLDKAFGGWDQSFEGQDQ